jgi:predicted DNA-binding protein YlxM (UPF0122 family)
MVHVTNEELQDIQNMNTEFAKAKLALADAEINKQSILDHIKSIRENFQKYEKSLIFKYGENSVINLQTGEVTKKNG